MSTGPECLPVTIQLLSNGNRSGIKIKFRQLVWRPPRKCIVYAKKSDISNPSQIRQAGGYNSKRNCGVISDDGRAYKGSFKGRLKRHRSNNQTPWYPGTWGQKMAQCNRLNDVPPKDISIFCSLKSANVTLFERRIFVDVVKDLKMRSSWVIQVGPKSNS